MEPECFVRYDNASRRAHCSPCSQPLLALAGGWAVRTCQPDRPGHVMSLLAAAAAADSGAKPTCQPPVFNTNAPCEGRRIATQYKKLGCQSQGVTHVRFSSTGTQQLNMECQSTRKSVMLQICQLPVKCCESALRGE